MSKKGQDSLRTAILRSGRSIDRRTLLRNSAAFGIAAPLLDGYLAVMSPGAMAQGGYDPKKYAGTEINLLMTGDENDHRAIGDLLGELEAETGIKVNISSPALAPLVEKTLQTLKSEKSPFEIIQYIGFLTTQQVGGGYFEQLNKYIEDPAETPPDWDFDDFLEPAMKNVGYYDLEKGELGVGKDVYGIPGVHSGSVIYFYRKDLFEAAGLQPAKTWDEFHEAAKILTTDDVAGCSMIGANDFSLGVVDWYTRFITTGGVLCSGSPKDGTFKPQVNTPEGINALQMLIDVLPFAPKNVTTYGFAENVDGWSAGKIAQMIFWVAVAGPVYNPDTSLVADVTGTGPVPAAPGNDPRAIQGGWGLGIPKNADESKKAAAWRALTWITNKRVNEYSVEKYQIDANRASTFQSPDLVEKFPYLPDALTAAQTAETIPTSLIDEFFQLNDIMNVEFNAALIGQQDAATACARVQSQWEDIFRKAGHLKA